MFSSLWYRLALAFRATVVLLAPLLSGSDNAIVICVQMCLVVWAYP
jgi:hypothetical protein